MRHELKRDREREALLVVLDTENLNNAPNKTALVERAFQERDRKHLHLPHGTNDKHNNYGRIDTSTQKDTQQHITDKPTLDHPLKLDTQNLDHIFDSQTNER